MDRADNIEGSITKFVAFSPKFKGDDILTNLGFQNSIWPKFSEKNNIETSD